MGGGREKNENVNSKIRIENKTILKWVDFKILLFVYIINDIIINDEYSSFVTTHHFGITMKGSQVEGSSPSFVHMVNM